MIVRVTRNFLRVVTDLKKFYIVVTQNVLLELNCTKHTASLTLCVTQICSVDFQKPPINRSCNLLLDNEFDQELCPLFLSDDLEDDARRYYFRHVSVS